MTDFSPGMIYLSMVPAELSRSCLSNLIFCKRGRTERVETGH